MLVLVLLGAAAAARGVGRCTGEKEGVGGGQLEAKAEEEGEQDGGARWCGRGARSPCRWCHDVLAAWFGVCVCGEGGSGS